ncbi:hypothetical protein GCM10027612_03190 [Microbispora bryophytorum subsp. camponoti]
MDAAAVSTEATVGGGGAPGVRLPSVAVSLPERLAAPLRRGEPPVVGRVEGAACFWTCAPCRRTGTARSSRPS